MEKLLVVVIITILLLVVRKSKGLIDLLKSIASAVVDAAAVAVLGKSMLAVEKIVVNTHNYKAFITNKHSHMAMASISNETEAKNEELIYYTEIIKLLKYKNIIDLKEGFYAKEDGTKLYIINVDHDIINRISKVAITIKLDGTITYEYGDGTLVAEKVEDIKDAKLKEIAIKMKSMPLSEFIMNPETNVFVENIIENIERYIFDQKKYRIQKLNNIKRYKLIIKIINKDILSLVQTRLETRDRNGLGDGPESIYIGSLPLKGIPTINNMFSFIGSENGSTLVNFYTKKFVKDYIIKNESDLYATKDLIRALLYTKTLTKYLPYKKDYLIRNMKIGFSNANELKGGTVIINSNTYNSLLEDLAKEKKYVAEETEHSFKLYLFGFKGMTRKLDSMFTGIYKDCDIIVNMDESKKLLNITDSLVQKYDVLHDVLESSYFKTNRHKGTYRAGAVFQSIMFGYEILIKRKLDFTVFNKKVSLKFDNDGIFHYERNEKLEGVFSKYDDFLKSLNNVKLNIFQRTKVFNVVKAFEDELRKDDQTSSKGSLDILNYPRIPGKGVATVVGNPDLKRNQIILPKYYKGLYKKIINMRFPLETRLHVLGLEVVGYNNCSYAEINPDTIELMLGDFDGDTILFLPYESFIGSENLDAVDLNTIKLDNNIKATKPIVTKGDWNEITWNKGFSILRSIIAKSKELVNKAGNMKKIMLLHTKAGYEFEVLDVFGLFNHQNIGIAKHLEALFYSDNKIHKDIKDLIDDPNLTYWTFVEKIEVEYEKLKGDWNSKNLKDFINKIKLYGNEVEEKDLFHYGMTSKEFNAKLQKLNIDWFTNKTFIVDGNQNSLLEQNIWDNNKKFNTFTLFGDTKEPMYKNTIITDAMIRAKANAFIAGGRYTQVAKNAHAIMDVSKVYYFEKNYEEELEIHTNYFMGIFEDFLKGIRENCSTKLKLFNDYLDSINLFLNYDRVYTWANRFGLLKEYTPELITYFNINVLGETEETYHLFDWVSQECLNLFVQLDSKYLKKLDDIEVIKKPIAKAYKVYKATGIKFNSFDQSISWVESSEEDEDTESNEE